LVRRGPGQLHPPAAGGAGPHSGGGAGNSPGAAELSNQGGGIPVKLSWLKGLSPAAKKLLGRYQYVLLVLAAGVLLLLLPLGGGGEDKNAHTPAQLQEEFNLEAFENRLAEALSQIQGAGEARVVLTLKSGSRRCWPRTPSGGRTGTPAPPPSPWARARA